MPISDIKYFRKKLKNGLDLIVAPMSESPTVTILVIFKVGSRDEQAKFSGISHFLEHMVFKGNKIYKTPRDISVAIDSLGGVFNAFTGKEYTGFHVKVGSQFAPLALKWLGALVTTPLVPSRDVNPERNVILEEINMYNDTPRQQVEDIFEGFLFSGSSLGRSIIGTNKSLSGIRAGELQSYYGKHYTPDRAILSVSGNLDNLTKKKITSVSGCSPIEKLVIKDFKFNHEPFSKSVISKVNGEQKNRVKVKFKKTGQTHLILGARTFSLFDKRRYPLALLSTVIGSGMSSWAFTEIREKRGLAYYVYSSIQLHQDVGYFSINAGLNNDKLSLAVSEIMKLFKTIRNKNLSTKELKKAKDQMIGGMLLERETSSDVAFLLGAEAASRGEITPLSKEVKIIKSIGKDDVRRVAEKFFAPAQLRLACIGPWRKNDGERFARLMK